VNKKRGDMKKSEKVGAGSNPVQKPIYGLIVSIQAQDELIKKYCFGECGNVLVAGADGGPGVGPLFLCDEEKENCMCHDRQTDESPGDIFGRPLYLRKLKQV